MVQNVKGTVDYYPEEENIKNKIFTRLSETAESFGYVRINTPAIEDFSLISKKQGEEIRSQIFTLEKKGEEDLALRAEHTPSFARLFVQKEKSLVKPVKWYNIGKSWRYERPQAGRLREFYQYNVELFGSSNPLSDAELISLAIESLKSLGLEEKDLKVKVNHRKILQGILSNFVEEDKVEELMRVIDKKGKVKKQDFCDMLSDHVDNPDELISILETDDIDKIDKVDDSFKKELVDIMDYLQDYDCIEFSPSTARGLAYYTGTVFEIFDNEEKLRSICGGGRYDNMIELYGGKPTPATGFGMGYSTLYLLLQKNDLLPSPEISPDYFIATMNTQKEALKLSKKLRKKGNKVEMNLLEKNLGNQLKYADKVGAKKLIVLGEEEVKSKKVKIKDMGTGEEKEKSLTNI